VIKILIHLLIQLIQLSAPPCNYSSRVVVHCYNCVVCYVILGNIDGSEINLWFDCVKLFSLWVLRPHRLSRLRS